MMRDSVFLSALREARRCKRFRRRCVLYLARIEVTNVLQTLFGSSPHGDGLVIASTLQSPNLSCWTSFGAPSSRTSPVFAPLDAPSTVHEADNAFTTNDLTLFTKWKTRGIASECAIATADHCSASHDKSLHGKRTDLYSSTSQR